MQANATNEPSSPVPNGLLCIVSGDGFSFIIEEEYAMVSTVIRTMMHSPFKESITRVIHLPIVKGRVLEKICQYFYYVRRFQNRQKLAATSPKKATDASPSPILDSFTENFDVPQELSLDLFLCAKYLDL